MNKFVEQYLSQRYCLTICFVHLSQMVGSALSMLDCLDFIDGNFKSILIIQRVKIFFIAQFSVENSKL